MKKGRAWGLALGNAALIALWLWLGGMRSPLPLGAPWIASLLSAQAALTALALRPSAAGRDWLRGGLAAAAAGAATVAVCAWPLPVGARREMLAQPMEMLPYGLAAALCLGGAWTRRSRGVRIAGIALCAAVLAVNGAAARIPNRMGERWDVWLQLAAQPALLSCLAACSVQPAREKSGWGLRALALAVAAGAGWMLAALTAFCLPHAGGVYGAWSPMGWWSRRNAVPLAMVAAAAPLLRTAFFGQGVMSLTRNKGKN